MFRNPLIFSQLCIVAKKTHPTAVAVPARQTQVLKAIATFGIDMVNLHRLSTVGFAGLTIFAATPGAFIDELFEGIPRQFTHAAV